MDIVEGSRCMSNSSGSQPYFDSRNPSLVGEHTIYKLIEAEIEIGNAPRAYTGHPNVP